MLCILICYVCMYVCYVCYVCSVCYVCYVWLCTVMYRFVILYNVMLCNAM